MKRFFAFSAVATALVIAALSSSGGPPEGDNDMTVDPVCQMNIHKSTAPFQDTFQGETFHFCNQNCYKLYNENKARYAATSQFLLSRTWRVTCFSRPAKIFAATDMQLRRFTLCVLGRFFHDEMKLHVGGGENLGRP